MKKTKNKNLRRAITFVLLAALVAVLAAMPLLASNKAPAEEYPLSILSAQAENRLLEQSISGGGVLAQGESLSVTVPKDVMLTEFLVENGDYVSAGDPIARVDRVTVMEAIAQTQETMKELQKQLESARLDDTTQTIRAPGGVVKAVYAAPGDLAVNVMSQHGALAVISLDERMMVEINAETELLAGDSVTILVSGEEVTGTVKTNLEGVLTVTLPDNGYDEGLMAQVWLEDTLLGEGALAIHAPWRAVAYSGTVDTVSVKPGQTLRENAQVLTLKDMGYSAQYRSLAAQHRASQEQMLELFQLYQSLTLTAPCDGVVSGIDESSAQLLGAGEAEWQLTLLANEPLGDDSQTYYNFVGQVLQVGTDGGVVLRVNPQFFSVADYANLSGIPTDVAAMTDQVETRLSAPVFQWMGSGSEESQPPSGSGESQPPSGGEDQDSTQDAPATQGGSPDTGNTGSPDTPEQEQPQSGWVTTGYAPGDILLFTGNSSGQIVWMIRLGSSPVGGGQGQMPGGFGGMGGMGGMGGTAQEEESLYGTDTVEVAQVTDQTAMTLDISVDELDLHYVALGQEVTIYVDALIGRSFPGTVTAISTTGANNGGNSKFTVTVTLDKAEDMLPGMNAAVTIPLGETEGLCVPLAALYHDGTKALVYTALSEEDGQPAVPVVVVTGFSDGEYVQITGLEPGQTVYYGYYEALNDTPWMPMAP